MDFHYDDWFPKEPNAGYETPIHDLMIATPPLFMSADMVEEPGASYSRCSTLAVQKPDFLLRVG